MTELTRNEKRQKLFDFLEAHSADCLSRSDSRLHSVHLRTDLVELLNNKAELNRFKGLTIHSDEFGILRPSSCGTRRQRMGMIDMYKSRTNLRELGPG
jgi:hypothetical protein